MQSASGLASGPPGPGTATAPAKKPSRSGLSRCSARSALVLAGGLVAIEVPGPLFAVLALCRQELPVQLLTLGPRCSTLQHPAALRLAERLGRIAGADQGLLPCRQRRTKTSRYSCDRALVFSRRLCHALASLAFADLGSRCLGIELAENTSTSPFHCVLRAELQQSQDAAAAPHLVPGHKRQCPRGFASHPRFSMFNNLSI